MDMLHFRVVSDSRDKTFDLVLKCGEPLTVAGMCRAVSEQFRWRDCRLDRTIWFE